MTKSRWRIEWEQGLMTLDERATDPAADDMTKAVHMLALFALRTHAPWLSHCIDCTTNPPPKASSENSAASRYTTRFDRPSGSAAAA